jgi:hypothetical protein
MPLWFMSFVLSVIYASVVSKPITQSVFYAERRHAECRYAESRYAECRSARNLTECH